MRTRITIDIEDDVLRATEVVTARKGLGEEEVVEEALKRYLALGVVDRVSLRSNLNEDEALALAHEELHKARSE